MSARLPDAPPGPEGVSLFLVPRLIRLKLTLEQAVERDRFFDSNLGPNDVTVRRLHDIGSSPCTYADIEFGGSTGRGANAYLMGKAGDGLEGIQQYVTHNNLQVALSAASCALSAYRASLKFAKDPLDYYPSIRTPENYVDTVGDWESGYSASSHDQTPPPLRRTDRARGVTSQPDVKRMLLAQKALSEGALALITHCMFLDDSICHAQLDMHSKRQLQALLRLLSPVAKGWVTEHALSSVQMACRVFDGMGRVTDNIACELLR